LMTWGILLLLSLSIWLQTSVAGDCLARLLPVDPVWRFVRWQLYLRRAVGKL